VPVGGASHSPGAVGGGGGDLTGRPRGPPAAQTPADQLERAHLSSDATNAQLATFTVVVPSTISKYVPLLSAFRRPSPSPFPPVLPSLPQLVRRSIFLPLAWGRQYHPTPPHSQLLPAIGRCGSPFLCDHLLTQHPTLLLCPHLHIHMLFPAPLPALKVSPSAGIAGTGGLEGLEEYSLLSCQIGGFGGPLSPVVFQLQIKRGNREGVRLHLMKNGVLPR